MAYCANCGIRLSDNAKFCSGCGINLNINEEDSVNNNPPTSWNREQFVEENPPNERGIITCPRCLGKGIVEDEDIERLSMQNYLDTGFCSYCDKLGLVNIEKLDTNEVIDINKGTKSLANSPEDNFVEDTSELEYKKINRLTWEPYFDDLYYFKRIYFDEDIPLKKLNAFIAEFLGKNKEEEFILQSKYMIYYDGDDRMLITVLDNQRVLVYISTLRYGTLRFELTDGMKIEYDGFTLVYSTADDDGDFMHLSQGYEPLLESLINFYEGNFQSDIL